MSGHLFCKRPGALRIVAARNANNSSSAGADRTAVRPEAERPTDPMISVDNALTHAVEFLNGRPEVALKEALEVLKAVPNHPIATLVVGSAERRLGRTASALKVLGNLARAQPWAAPVHFEYGHALAAAARPREAVAALRYAGELNPTLPGVWLALAAQLRATGDEAAADSACLLHKKAGTRDSARCTRRRI